MSKRESLEGKSLRLFGTFLCFDTVVWMVVFLNTSLLYFAGESTKQL